MIKPHASENGDRHPDPPVHPLNAAQLAANGEVGSPEELAKPSGSATTGPTSLESLVTAVGAKAVAKKKEAAAKKKGWSMGWKPPKKTEEVSAHHPASAPSPAKPAPVQHDASSPASEPQHHASSSSSSQDSLSPETLESALIGVSFPLQGGVPRTTPTLRLADADQGSFQAGRGAATSPSSSVASSASRSSTSTAAAAVAKGSSFSMASAISAEASPSGVTSSPLQRKLEERRSHAHAKRGGWGGFAGWGVAAALGMAWIAWSAFGPVSTSSDGVAEPPLVLARPASPLPGALTESAFVALQQRHAKLERRLEDWQIAAEVDVVPAAEFALERRRHLVAYDRLAELDAFVADQDQVIETLRDQVTHLRRALAARSVELDAVATRD